MLVIAAPGQGAQAPGFLTPWLDLPGFADRLAAWSDLAGCDLVRYGTTAGAEEITSTAIAQPLLVAAAIVLPLRHSAGILAASASRPASPPGTASGSRRRSDRRRAVRRGRDEPGRRARPGDGQGGLLLKQPA